MHTTESVIEIYAPAEDVWDALVNPQKVKLWQYGSELTTSWQPGSAIRFRTPWGESVFEQWGTVVSFDPPRSLKYSLFAPQPGLQDVPENYFFMTYSLEESEGKTRLSIMQEDPRLRAANPSESDGENATLTGLKNLIESASPNN